MKNGNGEHLSGELERMTAALYLLVEKVNYVETQMNALLSSIINLSEQTGAEKLALFEKVLRSIQKDHKRSLRLVLSTLPKPPKKKL